MDDSRETPGNTNPGRIPQTFLRRLIKWIARLAVVGVVGLAMLFAFLWWEHNTEVTLPAPTGHFGVGHTTFTWINDALTDELAPLPNAKREVAVWIWYPAAANSSASPVEYLPAAWRQAVAQYTGVLLGKFLTRDLSLVHAHSTTDPEVSTEQRSFPVVIMRAGLGALTADYTTLAEDLASHGYIVVGLDAPYRTFVFVSSDGSVIRRPQQYNPENLPQDQAERLANRLLPMWTDDVKFVVSQLERLNAGDPSGRFTGRLDLERLGMFGHSFGGAQALQFCHDNAQCKAGIDIDGIPFGSVVQEGLKQPFMIMLSDHSGEAADPESAKIHEELQSIYDRLPNGRIFITIRGANHFSFSDQMLLKSHAIITLLRWVGIAPLGGRRGLAITTEYVHTFFDVYLKGAPRDSLDAVSQRYPEAQIGLPR